MCNLSRRLKDTLYEGDTGRSKEDRTLSSESGITNQAAFSDGKSRQ